MALNQDLKNGIVEQMMGLKEQDEKKSPIKKSDKKSIEEPVKESTKVSNDSNLYSSLIFTEKKEIKSKRVNFMVKASSHANFKAKCESLGVSMNDVIDRFMADFSVKGD